MTTPSSPRWSHIWSDRLHRRLHAHLVGRAPAPALRHRRDAGHGRGQPRSTTQPRSPPTFRRWSSCTPRAYERRNRSPRTTGCYEREQVARRPARARGSADRPRHGQPDPRLRRSARPPDAARDRAARAGARFRSRARGDPTDPAWTETAQRTATSLQGDAGRRRGRPADRRSHRGRGGRSGMIEAGTAIPGARVWRSPTT